MTDSTKTDSTADSTKLTARADSTDERMPVMTRTEATERLYAARRLAALAEIGEGDSKTYHELLAPILDRISKTVPSWEIVELLLNDESACRHLNLR